MGMDTFGRHEILVVRLDGDRSVARLEITHENESIESALNRARNLYSDVGHVQYLGRVGRPETVAMASA